MRITIDTDGDGNSTLVYLNGNLQKNLKEFHLSIHYQKKVKLQMIKEIDGTTEFLSYFGEDFNKFDEVNNKPK